MNRRIIITLFIIIISLTACSEEKQMDDTIRKYTEKVMLEREIPVIRNEKNETNENEEDDIDNDKETIIDNSTFKEDNNYPIHKGRIDCKNLEECIEKSAQYKNIFNDVIDDIHYVDVINSKGDVIGYFIDYKFKEYDYKSLEECKNIGIEIKKSLYDRIETYECSPNGILTITTDNMENLND